LNKYIEESGFNNTKIVSMPAAPILGTAKDVPMSRDPELQEQLKEAEEAECLSLVNEATQSWFIPEVTASPHPRFLGLA
jgi:hypothetical protein